MASNRAQRRAANKKGKRPGETYADLLARQRDIKQAIEKAARDETVALETDIKTQRFLWMAVVANYEAFGHAGVRAQRFMLTLDNVREDMEKMAAKDGWEYAVEKLRAQCERITGMEVKQVHEERMIQARKENEAKGIFFPAESPETLARIGFERAADQGPKWISVEERLPDPNGDGYLVVVKYKYACEKEFSYDTDVATYTPYEGGYIDGCWNTWNDWDEGQEHIHVTHWMPLPEPMKEKANGN